MTGLERFANRTPLFERLPAYGFVRAGGVYTYQTSIAGGQLAMAVQVAPDGRVTARLTDSATGEEYRLHLAPAATGAFVGKVRAAYDQVLEGIAAACFEADVFQSAGARALIAYVRQRYGDELEFLWEKSPGNAIWRRKDTGKWYAVLLTLPRFRLGLEGDGAVEILDLRLAPEQLAGLIDHQRYFPGYHMNKKHWYTLLLDGPVPVEELCQRLEESYRLAVK